MMAAALLMLVAVGLPLAGTLSRQVYSMPETVQRFLQRQHDPYTPLSQVSPQMQHAIVAIEDRRFYRHSGIDLYALARVVIGDLRFGRLETGGATLSMQLVKNALQLPSNPALRAGDILALAWLSVHDLGHSRVLELYLNRVYYGRNAYGIAAAARVYFGERPSQLDAAHAAFLAALPQAPSWYGSHPTSAVFRLRVQTVLEDMRGLGYLTARQEKRALVERVVMRFPQGSHAR